MQSNLSEKLAEKKLVTIMFIDMVDSLGAIRDLDPEDAQELFSGARRIMSDAVHAFGGVVASTQGDGLMALFGAPAAKEDHAVRACLAALHLQKQVSKADPGAPAIRTRIGIHSGIVAIGGLGNEFEAAGAVVHIASRLQNFAPPGKAILTAKTQALVANDIATDFMGSITVKGLNEPIDAFVLTGPLTASHRIFRREGDGFVGRVSQLRALESAFRSSMRGHGAIVGIVGEAGIGKTALVQSFVARCPSDVKILPSRAERYDVTTSLTLFRDVISTLLEIGTVKSEQRTELLSPRLRALRAPDSRHIDALCDLCDLSVQNLHWKDLIPRQRREAIFSAVKEVLVIESRRQPLLLCLEDLQRADSASIELLDILANVVASARILIVVTYRSEFTCTLSENTNFRLIKVDSLSRAETKRLIDQLLGRAAKTPLSNTIVNRCGGNPLFAHEIVRGLVDSGILGGPANRRVLLKEDAEAATPLSIVGIIAERIDSLPPDLKETLLAASVLGERFTAAILARTVHLSQDEIRRRLRLLELGEFIRSENSEFCFVHGLFQEVAYGTLLKRLRQSLHEAAFRALTSASSSSEPSMERLAYHAFHGCIWREAVKYCWEAGRRAAARWSNREAITHFGNALAALERRSTKEGWSTEERWSTDAIDLRLELRLAHLALLHLSKVGELLDEAHALALHAGHRHQLAKIVGFMGAHAYLTRTCADCADLCKQSLRLTRKVPDKKFRIAPTLYLAQALYGLGNFRQVISRITRILPTIERGNGEESVGLLGNAFLMSLYWITVSKAELGAFDEAEFFCNKMLSVVRPLQPFEYIYSQTALGFVLLLKGDYEAALIPSRLAVEAADKTDTPFMIPVSASQLGLLLVKQGQCSEGLEMGHRAVRTAEKIGVRAGRSRWIARLAEGCFWAGELQDAGSYAEAAANIAEEAREPAYLCTALRLRARLRAVNGDLEESRADLRRARSIARNLELGPELAKCHYNLGEVELRAGRSSVAMREFATAERVFRRFGMASWVKTMKDATPSGLRFCRS